MGDDLWSTGDVELGAYLSRIGYAGPLQPSADTLRQLHRQHVRSIPFENLEILLGRAIDLDLASVQKKLVGSRRGGYCFEHNLLFAAVLGRLGFTFTGLSARVTLGSQARRPQTHMCLRVEVDGEPWLADVGFGGDGLLEPMPMQAGLEVQQGSGRWEYSLAATDGTWELWSSRPPGRVQLYTFTLEPRWPIDYMVANWYTSTHPHSAFTIHAIAQRVGDDLRTSLIDGELVRIRPGWRHEERRLEPGDQPRILSEIFDIELNPEDATALERRLSSGKPRRAPNSSMTPGHAPVPRTTPSEA